MRSFPIVAVLTVGFAIDGHKVLGRNWLLAGLESGCQSHASKIQEWATHGTLEALLMPFPLQRLERLLFIPDWHLASLALGPMQLDIAFRTEGVPSVNDVRGGLVFLSIYGVLALRFGTGRRGTRRIEERGSAFAAEKVQLMVEPLTERRIVDGDVPLVHDWRLAVITFAAKLLRQTSGRTNGDVWRRLTSK
jgi:hypothetical protein